MTALVYRKGDTGRMVRDIQGVVGVSVDGRFGTRTDAAVRAWQSSHGLTPDGAVGPLTQAAMGILYIVGVDVSHHNRALNWAKAYEGGVRFAIVKASEGQTYRDPKARAHLDAAREQGMRVGVYHFASASASLADALKEARNLHNAASVLGTIDLPPVLDIESNPADLTPAALLAWCRAFLQETSRLFGRTPMVYTFRGFMSQLDGGASLDGYPLWFARVTNAKDPGPTGDWTTWDIWQHTTAAGVIPGAVGRIDQNRLAGGQAGLDRLCSL